MRRPPCATWMIVSAVSRSPTGAEWKSSAAGSGSRTSRAEEWSHEHEGRGLAGDELGRVIGRYVGR
jgi:hypothetical protein